MRQLCEVRKLTTGASVADIQLSKSGKILLAAHGKTVSFWDTQKYII